MKDINKKNLDVILEWFSKSDLTSATIQYDEKGGYKISLSRAAESHPAPAAAPSVQTHQRAPAPPATHAIGDASPALADNQKEIYAPIVGTFYRSSGPDAPPFVQSGDIVKKGQTLCIIEAMKVMNELEAEFDMEIVSVLVENSELVEYNQPLFIVKSL